MPRDRLDAVRGHERARCERRLCGLLQDPFGGRLPIDVTTMADFDDHDDKIKILNLVQDSVVPLSKTVLVVPREFLAAWRPRVARQRQDLRDDPSAVLLREGFDLLAGRRLDEQPIACHDAEGPSRPPRNQGSVPWPWHEMRRDRRHPLRGFAGARRSPDRKQIAQSPLPSCAQLDGGRRRGRWSPAWSRSYGQRSVITSKRQLVIAPPNTRMEPTRLTVLCDHLAAARGAFGTLAGSVLGDEHDVQRPRSVDALDARHLDVRRGRRA